MSAPWKKDAMGIGLVAFAVRLAMVAWAAGRFPPTADGVFYQRIATRIAQGLGYTWLWPDGVVTYAAHYPIGYPAALGAVYFVTGPRAAAAMAFNAALGALGAVAVHRLAARAGTRRGAAIAGLLVALHPGLVAYTPALMTEGVTASLWACAAWAAARARDAATASRPWLGPIALLGVVVGAATLVRPQSILLAPLLGWLAMLAARREPPSSDAARARLGPGLRAAAAAAVATAATLAVCAPWTLRNCGRMHRCALVSVNAGWNLLIGADDASTGAWSPVRVPAPCRDVFDEAAKDECFEREARRWIADRPARWVALAPRKLAATFDYCGAAPWYLHDANPEAFGVRAKVALGAVETIYERAVLLIALGWAGGFGERDRTRWRRRIPSAAAVVGAAFTFMEHAWVSYVAFALAATLRGRALVRGPMLGPAAVGVVVSAALAHAVFFGAGRYSLVVFPLVCGAAGLALGSRRGGAEGSFDKQPATRHPSVPEETPRCL